MLWTQGFLINRQCALVEWSGASVIALVFIQLCQIVEHLRHVAMIRPEGFLHYRQGALVERSGTSVVALGLIQRRQIVERGPHVAMIRPKGFLINRQNFLGQRNCFGVATSLIELDDLLVKAL